MRVSTNGGYLLKWMVYWKIQLKGMIGVYPYFRKLPHVHQMIDLLNFEMVGVLMGMFLMGMAHTHQDSNHLKV